MSGAPVLVQFVPPLVVTQTPRFVAEPFVPSAIEAYTVLPVASEGAMPRSMRPIAEVVGWAATGLKVIALQEEAFAFVDL